MLSIICDLVHITLVTQATKYPQKVDFMTSSNGCFDPNSKFPHLNVRANSYIMDPVPGIEPPG